MRVTQLTDLTLLAPEVQEQILFAKSVDGVESMSESALREVVRLEDWANQRAAPSSIWVGGCCRWWVSPVLRRLRDLRETLLRRDRLQPVPGLHRDHPARVLRGQRARRIQARNLVPRQP